MGVFTCTKPATFAGVKYMPGDTVPVTLEDGTVYDATVTPEAVVELVAVLQTTVEGATARVKAITDGTALILIDACDSRKTIKKAAAARAAELEGKPGTEETGGGEPPAGGEGE